LNIITGNDIQETDRGGTVEIVAMAGGNDKKYASG